MNITLLYFKWFGRSDNDNSKYFCYYLRWQHGPSDVVDPFSGFLHKPQFFLFLFVSHMLSLLYQNRGISRLIDVILTILGFVDLSLYDQVRLLESCWMEVLMIGLMWRSIDHPGKLIFAPDLVLDR